MSPIQIPPSDEILCIGPSCLSDAKLLSLILGSALSKTECSALVTALHLDSSARTEQLRHSIHGPKLMAALELGKRVIWNGHLEPTRVIRSPEDARMFAMPHFCDDVESLVVFALDKRLSIARISILNGQSAQHIDTTPARILSPILASGCDRFLCVHTHPSGIATPSASDIKATQTLQDLGEQLGVRLVDHVIIGGQQHFSFHKERLLYGDEPLYGQSRQ